MIGQKNLQSRIEQLIKDRTFPRFSILVGPKGSGKKTIVPEIAGRMLANYVKALDVKIDTIREIIQQSYKVVDATVYFIPDADNMSNAAKNALLKVTEEPPNNAYFIMTLEDENNTLETIRSRGTVFHMDRYTPDEIYQYAMAYAHDNEDIIKDICETPGDVDLLYKDSPKEFYDYVQLVVDNIAEVSLANAFKIPNKVALKEDAEGYDLRLFWKAFISVCMTRRKTPEQAKDHFKAAYITSKYLQKLRVKGINRSMLMDNWVLEIRKLWMKNRGLKNV